jgi:O-antigen ligase
VVGFVVLGFALTRRQRIQSGFVGFLVLLAAFMLQPGLLGTLGRMFTGVGEDASARSRTDSYAYALHALASHPIVGKGFGTFLPKYRILDNQWLLGAIEIGVVGVLALLVLMGAVVISGFRSERRLEERADRVVSRSLTASILAVCVGMLFYDGFSFPQATGLLFLACGVVAAAFRLSTESEPKPLRLRGFRGNRAMRA